jgi:hypothetical protein
MLLVGQDSYEEKHWKPKTCTQIMIYLWLSSYCQTYVIPDKIMGFVDNKRLSPRIVSVRAKVR